MENIWGMILQTVTVSLTAAILLLIKRLMVDKLSPRWQYGVWSVLALRILVPVSMRRFVLGPWPLWMEMVKSKAESMLSSAYADTYETIAMKSVLPRITGRPVSITDWLFVVYSAGIAVFLMRYLLAYLRLRGVLRKSALVSEQAPNCIREVCDKYKLKECKVVEVWDIPSAFVCGLIRPVLVVPAGMMMDEKVILHELLHLRYWDAWQSTFWCILRCLHWFNPFMHYVFDRIENDMESLCDQRVLERLRGEERREYGAILLGMANDRYARVPGTTSISNGGKNISRRIEAIVRFKKYPRGMELVSACSIVLMLCPVLVGTAGSFDRYYTQASVSELLEVMAIARINRCSTKAGALDTYAKGLMFERGFYIAMVTPEEKHPELAEKLARQAEEQMGILWTLDSGWELQYTKRTFQYGVYNLQEIRPEEYTAVLFIYVDQFQDPENPADCLKNEDGSVISRGSVQIPVRLWWEDGWMVEECGERMIKSSSTAEQRLVEPMKRWTLEGETGTLTIESLVQYGVKDSSGNSRIGGFDMINEFPITDAQFEMARVWRNLLYEMDPALKEQWPVRGISFKEARPLEEDTEIIFPDRESGELQGHDSSKGIHSYITSVNTDGVVRLSSTSVVDNVGDDPVQCSDIFWIGIYWEDELAERFRIEDIYD